MLTSLSQFSKLKLLCESKFFSFFLAHCQASNFWHDTYKFRLCLYLTILTIQCTLCCIRLRRLFGNHGSRKNWVLFMPMWACFSLEWSKKKNIFFENWLIQKCNFFQIQSMIIFKALKSGKTDGKGMGGVVRQTWKR